MATAKTTRARKTTTNAEEPITLGAVRVAFAQQKNISTADAGKILRRKLRSTNVWSALTEADPANYGKDGKVKNDANDRRPWGTLPRTFVRDVLNVESV